MVRRSHHVGQPVLRLTGLHLRSFEPTYVRLRTARPIDAFDSPSWPVAQTLPANQMGLYPYCLGRSILPIFMLTCQRIDYRAEAFHTQGRWWQSESPPMLDHLKFLWQLVLGIPDRYQNQACYETRHRNQREIGSENGIER